MAAPVPRVSLYGLDDHRLPGTVRGRLQERQAKLAGDLAAGNAEDWPDYKLRVGVIRGLKDAIDICTEIETEMQKR